LNTVYIEKTKTYRGIITEPIDYFEPWRHNFEILKHQNGEAIVVEGGLIFDAFLCLDSLIFHVFKDKVPVKI
jgi:hypothetical protein